MAQSPDPIPIQRPPSESFCLAVEARPPGKAAPQIAFNWQDWLPWLEEAEATDDEKRQLIEALWSIVSAFVDLGWDVTPESCGQVPDLTQALREAVLRSDLKPSDEEGGQP